MRQNFPTIILDGDNLVREGISFILSQKPFLPQICVRDFDELQALPTDKPVLFIMMVIDSLALAGKIGRIRERYPLSRIALMAEDSNRDRLSGALEVGANAALLTSMTPEGLVKSLQALMSDELIVLDAKLMMSTAAPHGVDGPGQSPIADHASPIDLSQHPTKGLSAREIEILDRIVQGDSNKLIARRFDIAEATVKAHVKAILRKIGVINRTQAAIWAMNAKPGEPRERSGSDEARSRFEESETRAAAE